MLRIGKLTDYATVVLAVLAKDPHQHRAATELAAHTHLSRTTVSKVLKGLQRAGLVQSALGAHGGYRLARDPELITAAQILDVFEGPVAITECASRSSYCDIEQACGVGRSWQRVSALIRGALEDITLRQLAGLDHTLIHISRLPGSVRPTLPR